MRAWYRVLNVQNRVWGYSVNVGTWETLSLAARGSLKNYYKGCTKSVR